MYSFMVEVILVTMSGALSPGPLTIATLRRGLDEGWVAGFKASLGHMIFEFPLVFALAFGVFQVFNLSLFRVVAGLVGGAILAIYGYLQLSSQVNGSRGRVVGGSAFWIGFTLTAFNPYFIVWWLTVGLKLIVDALAIASMTGVVVMYFAHVWMDYVWLMLVSYLAGKGRSFLNDRSARMLNIVLAVVMFFFAFRFIAESLTTLFWR